MRDELQIDATPWERRPTLYPLRRVDQSPQFKIVTTKSVPTDHPPIDSFSTLRTSGRTARIFSSTSSTSAAPMKSGFSLVIRS